VFKIHIALNPFSGIDDSTVVRSVISRQAECFYLDDADDTITPKAVVSRQLVPAGELNNKP
jgi:hypothetical protein